MEPKDCFRYDYNYIFYFYNTHCRNTLDVVLLFCFRLTISSSVKGLSASTLDEDEMGQTLTDIDSSIYPRVSITELIRNFPSEKWDTEPSTDFSFILASNVTNLTSTIYYAPRAKFNDGCLQLGYCVQPVTRPKLLKIIAAMTNGEHIHMPEMKFIAVQSFQLEFTEVDSHMNLVIDGEKVPNADKIKCTVLPRLARIIY